MTNNPLDDTQPVRTLPPEPHGEPSVYGSLDPDGPRMYQPQSGMGCGSAILIFGVLGLFALGIVGLSATAGWTTGQRTAASNATSTADADTALQVELVSTDIAGGSFELASYRIQYLATQQSGMPALPSLLETGTAVYLTLQPTATLTPTQTPTASPTDAGPTASPTLEATATLADPFDLAGRLARAQSAVSLGQWLDAIDELDVIIGIDPNYEVALVRSLMSRALNAEALQRYRMGDLGEAIYLTDRAEDFGPLADGLEFERYVAQLYLSARSRVGTNDYIGAINALQEVVSLSPNYQNGEVQRLLFNNYVLYADALTYGSPCAAVTQYTNALRLFSDPQVSDKRTVAENWCENGTPTPEGFVPTVDPGNPNGQTAPIGQPGS
ncbi:MAG: tetratricopeptide repeat protein [Chloroflexi bacterium]|nr:tetratricopeptide repeat protein [Chloroflexota bacterium]